VSLHQSCARFGAKRALGSAHLHGGVVAESLACFVAQSAGFGTRATHLDLKWSTAGDHLRCHGTEIGAVAASFRSCQMVCMAIAQHL
jgi:hypothetical protein